METQVNIERLRCVINDDITYKSYHKIKGCDSYQKAKILIEKFIDRTIKKLLKENK